MISDKKEALYLIDNESYLHLKEMETGFAYEAFDKSTGAAQYTGLITYEDMLENLIRNPIACARVMAIQEIGFKGGFRSCSSHPGSDQGRQASLSKGAPGGSS